MKQAIITGSHLTPALALIAELQNHDWQITYLGGGHLEDQLLPKSVNRFSIKAPKLHRHNYLILGLDILRLPFSIFSAYKILRKIKPKIVVSFGGYLGLPVSLASYCLNIPLIIHEQTFQSGLTSKITGLLANKVALSWPTSLPYFPKHKATLVGNPLRKDFFQIKQNSEKKLPPTIYITGGSQGSKVINKVVSEILLDLLKKYKVIHQFGLNQSSLDWTQQLNFKTNLPRHLYHRYQLTQWLSTKETAETLSRADLVIGRSGVNTVTEIGYLHKHSILIPLPFAQKNEQLVNAKYLSKLGIATIIEQSQLNKESLMQAIEGRLSNPLPHSKFPKDLVKNAAKNLYQLVESSCDKKN